ncbi:MAG: thiamine/thiamine pyrophosphate ABC transporter permease ThiP [Gemmobacter sp.]|uniref:thiamine/thiamine pyrophosphate ABC transporter permease ThiP n=1 Tax=Gemmobacter sp. TaxID=1898957 RepID=UPI00391DA5CF
MSAGGASALHRPSPGIRAGQLAALAIAGLILACLVALLLQAGRPRLGPADWAAVRFTLAQAAVSALVSAALAVPVARALARRRFAGRAGLVAALGVPFLLPVIVAVLALLAVFGRNGAVNAGLAGLGLPGVNIYGPHGVVLAHVFLNLPLAVRMLLHGWQAIPAERVRLAQALGLGPGGMWCHVELPMLRAVLPGAMLAVFLICLTSFAVALILGGGPAATTVELAIYQAVRFDFDLPRAAALAGLQFALCAAAVLLAARWTQPAAAGAGLGRPLVLPRPGGWRRAADALAIAAAAMFLLAPLAVVVVRGLPGLGALPAPVWAAAGRSVLLALAVAAMTAAALLALGAAAARRGAAARAVELAGMLPMAASALVLGTGLFLLLDPFVAPPRLALPVTALVNLLLALPFALRLVLPAWRAAEATQGRLADALGLTGLARLRHAIWPQLRRPFGMALGLSAALAMGDLGVIALFATEGNATLPLQVWRLMGAYRTEAAEAAALLLVGLSLALFLIFDLWGRCHADA